MSDFYKILGIEKTASEADIKKAYRKLSKKYHPDKGGDEDKFKEIAEAYATLSDTEKRKMYDLGGNGGINYNDFGFSGSPFRQKKTVRRGSDLRLNIKITLEEISKGVKKKVKYNHLTHCDECSGSGGTSKTCDTCHGTGMITRIARTPMGIIQSAQTCHVCNGEGESIDKPCAKCNGSGLQSTPNEIEFDVPKGVNNNDTLVYGGAGNFVRNGIPGDVLIRIIQEEHNDFIREGNDLYYDLELTYPQLILGGKFKVPLITGSEISITIPENTSVSKINRVAGKGIQSEIGVNGDLYIKLKLKSIGTLTSNMKSSLNKLQKELDKEK